MLERAARKFRSLRSFVARGVKKRDTANCCIIIPRATIAECVVGSFQPQLDRVVGATRHKGGLCKVAIVSRRMRGTTRQPMPRGWGVTLLEEATKHVRDTRPQSK